MSRFAPAFPRPKPILGVIHLPRPAEPVPNVVHTTGAGDTFAAGFLGEYTRSRAAREGLARGAAAAAESVQRVGAFPWQDR